MRVSALSWMRYRSFKERQRVEITPITVIIGRNGSGKSVISRLLPLLASGIAEDATDTLDLSAGGILHAATYQDLVHSRGRLPFSLGIEVSGEGKKYEFETSLRYVSEFKNLVVESFWIKDENKNLIDLRLEDENQLTAEKPRYMLFENGSGRPTEIIFNGLLPNTEKFDSSLRNELNQAFASIREALPMPSYLGPFRVQADRPIRALGQRIKSLGSKGEHAIELLAEDKIRFGGTLIQNASKWFARALKQGIEIEVLDDRSQLIVTDIRSNTNVSLADTGAGFAQVLPVVIQHFAFRKNRLPSSTLIVEQPELHLHPGAHGDVMDLALQTINSTEINKVPNCIFETHSEQIIMRLRRRIAEGFDPDKVSLWSLNHRETDEIDGEEDGLKIIRFDESGNPDAWPRGVFEETLDDLTSLRQAVREKKSENFHTIENT